MDEVMLDLLDDEVTAVGVCGMGGVGKTTLVEHVAARARKNGVFDYVIKVVVSQLLDLTKIQRNLAALLGFRLMEVTEIGRAARLHLEIMRREKILIILDDRWERINLPSIGIPSYKELQKCNSKVLLTTRLRNACYAMSCQKIITLNVLSEQDSWALFLRKARRSFESPAFESVAKKVAGECRGLPIALITVARALRDKELVEWKKAAHRLEKSLTAYFDGDGAAWSCVRLSYDYLIDEDYKSIFLLCCLFPEDRAIEIEVLFRYAIGRGLLQDAETVSEARGTTHAVVKYLIDSGLLLESDDAGFVKMHKVVRDVAMSIATSEDGHGFLVIAGHWLHGWPRRLQNDIHKLPPQLGRTS